MTRAGLSFLSFKQYNVMKGAAVVENRKVTFKEDVILESTNTNKKETQCYSYKNEEGEKISKQVNEKRASYKDALVRLNYS
jgi:hypothetical protein